MPSEISLDKSLVNPYNAQLFTPFSGKNFQSPLNNKSSGFFSDSYRRNNLPISPYDENANQTRGRKLIGDFNDVAINENNINTTQNIHILNNESSFLTPNKKGYQREQNVVNNIYDKQVNNNQKNLFFTDCGLGYKCNCQKTNCNKQYCQCFREERYCFNCNCTDCQNQKPVDRSSNKHPTNLEESKSKKEIKISCTCTKSGCNKNYCECFKSNIKCNSQCRCRNCENYEKKGKIVYNSTNTGSIKYECCLVNSIYIINNKINLDLKKNTSFTVGEVSIFSFSSGHKEENKKLINRKREKIIKNEEEVEISKKKAKLKEDVSFESEKEKNNKDSTLENSLFDKDGNLVLSNYKILELK